LIAAIVMRGIITRMGNLIEITNWSFILLGMRTELVSALVENAAELISEVSAKHEPVLITQEDGPAAYLVDAQTYESMETRIRILEGIARGERAILEGRVYPHDEAKKRMGKWLK
jgi:prevent-host-death family protein